MMEIIKSGESREKAHKKIRALIPSPTNEDAVENLVLPIGFTLLQEITFNLLVYLDADVNSKLLRDLLFKEYMTIALALVRAPVLYKKAQELVKNGE